ncbi:MAG: LacI family DNA-binding transcriptional regulator [Rhodospirillaceae bacterium]|nr:LacI family DNA-binding transcriptional regulator [Rhodospirillaceae bacterium]MDD9999304.1 LacI family DNA-binding transcriptional regulator [Rhodospirillaceae bacterium]MDE0361633.1 LacI family DNA-binding transcriptional regulator [Rhodospirillaceae bacterium]
MVPPPANIKDVASRAGVHPSTVSRVLNPATRSMVSDHLARKIMRVAEELGYRRNPLAAGLRTQRTHTVGIVLPDITNPVFPPMVRGAEHTLGAEGYTAILADSGGRRRSERTILEDMKTRRVDGLIIAAARRKDPIVDECVELAIPLVLVNRTVDKHNVAAVINDDELGIELALEHLQALGHHRVAYVGGPQSTSTGYVRYRTFIRSSKRLGLNVDRQMVVNARDYTESAGQRAFKRILERKKDFTAVLTANDLLALGCYDGIRACGLKCPDDISVTGFNDMPFVDRFDPPLTTLHIPLDDLGVQAAQLLLERIRQPDAPVKQLRLEPRIVVRGSTAPPASE